MDYMEIVNTIRSGDKVNSDDVSGIQLFMLLRDRVIKQIEVKKIGIFELNFVPVEEDDILVRPLRLNKDNCFSFFTAGTFIKDLVKQYKRGQKNLYVAIEDETFQLYIEELESNE
jgi:hypothetical protein